MAMQFTVPPDLQGLIEKRLSSGSYANVEDVLRRVLETLDAEESWTEDECRALNDKIERALEQVAAGRVYGPNEARQKLAALRDAHLAQR